MSNAIVPVDILKIMEQEYTNMNLKIVEVICQTYDLDLSDVKSMLKDKMSIQFDINDGKNNYRLVQRKGSSIQNKVKDEERCIANIYDSTVKTVRRCTRSRIDRCLLCAVHLRMHKNDRLKLYGVADGYEKQYQEFSDAPCEEILNKVTPLQGLKKQVVRKIK